ncbi:MAG: LysE family transporter [Campylobacter sp.]|nr:LysE family transporter [Campylobacter sp.]
MDIFLIFSIIITHFIALIVPGPDIFLILRTSLAHGFKQSIFACLGVGAGVFLWVVLTAFGLKSLFALFPLAKLVLMVFSVCYLGYLSFILFSSSLSKKEAKIDMKSEKQISAKRFFIIGFLTNLSNPKAILYFASIFSRFVDKTDSLLQIGILVAIICVESVLSFILVGKLFSAQKAREAFLKNQKILDGICATIFAIFALIILYEFIAEFL